MTAARRRAVEPRRPIGGGEAGRCRRYRLAQEAAAGGGAAIMSYSGYGDWSSGTNRGYEGYSYGYGYGQDNSGNYGYGMATSNSWEMGNSDVDMNPDASGGANADGVIVKMNQRLDMVSHLDTDTMQGGHYGSGGDRYDSYESYDSRSSMNDRDLYRSGYDYNEAEHDNDNAYDGHYDGPYDGHYEGHYDSFYGNRRDQYHNRARDNFGQRGQNWARDGHNNRPMASSYSGRMGGQWNEPPQGMGARGLGPHGSSRLPSLFSHNIIPELGMFQGMRGFSGNMRFGGGMMKQRMRRNWKMWDSDFKQQKKKMKKDPTTKKRKQTNSSDEPDCKAAKTDGSDNSDSDNEEGTEGESGEKEEKEGSRGEGEDDEGRDSEKGALTIQEEISQIKRKLQAGKKTQERQKKRHRDRMVERIQFVCSLCKYRTFYDDEMNSHLESKFHKEHFKFVGTKLPQQTADFLQEYVANKTRKTEERRKAIEDINAVIQQIYRDQDLTQDVGMEHFIKKVEAAHCAACDLFIPMQYGIIQKHLKSLDHNHNRRAMMEQSKKSSLVVARSILNNKLISKKLERYLKGENPFTDDLEEKEEHEEGEGGTSGNAEEETAEGADENKDDEENLEEENLDDENKVEENLDDENKVEENLDDENKVEENVDDENEDPGENPEAEGAKIEEEQEEPGTETETEAQPQAQTDLEPGAENMEETLQPTDESVHEEKEQQPEGGKVEDEDEESEEAAAQEDEDAE
ncbi:A-kinase anchor protein 8-like isoform X3 [Oxyura jamaicensis]|uniref:A-kinase anchor protein 8-like isoform X3 n=1 Tax=Oxyura jamaicensis TaxID=8884 RepID=UPI0015A56BD8|nr:A-kinase anchor protein 8-like isoform X3 [Oxyura jamaicensis]